MKPRIFVSYSHRGNGEHWKNALLDSLAPLVAHDLADVWQDGRIRVSSFWNDEIEDAIRGACVAIVLLTPEALSSKYIVERELPLLRDRQANADLAVHPIVCEPCDWKEHPWLRATQAAAADSPLNSRQEQEQRCELRQLASDIASQLSRWVLEHRPQPLGAKSDLPPRLHLPALPLEASPGDPIDCFFGREQELALLDLAYASNDTTVASLIGWGGFGKTILVRHWLRRVQRAGWREAHRVFAWSFQAGGSAAPLGASEDAFLTDALDWFDVRAEPSLPSSEKGRLLAAAISAAPSILVLDGLEPLQHPPGPMGGQLRSPGLSSLLRHLARTPTRHPDRDRLGLCVVTSREPITELFSFEASRARTGRGAVRIQLSGLPPESGAALLHASGATRAGWAKIEATDVELTAASEALRGHPLTLSLLGRYIARAHGGDIRKRDRVLFEEAGRREQGGATETMLEVFESWFGEEGEIEQRALSILRLLGLFDRAAAPTPLAALRTPPAIAGLTEALFRGGADPSEEDRGGRPLGEAAWNSAVSFLADFQLVHLSPSDRSEVAGFDESTARLMRVYGLMGTSPSLMTPRENWSGQSEVEINVHPMVREFFTRRLRAADPSAYREGQRRIFRSLADSVPYWPEGLHGLRPLYQAVFHACESGEEASALEEVFKARIARSTTGPMANYSMFGLGAVDTDLAALSAFFSKPWSELRRGLPEAARSYVLGEAAFRLRAVGRLSEAIELFVSAGQGSESLGELNNATIDAGNECEVRLLVGDVSGAIRAGERAVQHADRLYESDRWPTLEAPSWRIHMRARLGNAHFHAGHIDLARRLFTEAESFQRDAQADYPILYSISGYHQCELILADSERAAWAALIGDPGDRVSGVDLSETWAAYRRAGQMLEWQRETGGRLLEIALGNLTISRAGLFREIIDHRIGNAPWPTLGSRLSPYKEQAELVVNALNRFGAQEFLPPALLTRAVIRHLMADEAGAHADFDEAWDLVSRAGMRLAMADVALARHRLLAPQRPATSGASDRDLQLARRLIFETGYGRRAGELKDAEVAWREGSAP